MVDPPKKEGSAPIIAFIVKLVKMENRGVGAREGTHRTWGMGVGEGNTEKIEILKKWGHTEKTKKIPMGPEGDPWHLGRGGRGTAMRGIFSVFQFFQYYPLRGHGSRGAEESEAI